MRVRLEPGARAVQRFDSLAEQGAPLAQFRFRKDRADEFAQHQGEGQLTAFKALKAVFDRFVGHPGIVTLAELESIR